MTSTTTTATTLRYTITDSPVGAILLTSDGKNLTGLYLDDFDKIIERLAGVARSEPREDPDLDVFAEARRQL
ncbi:MAG: methylated-DNA--[protein]-cysteine S-methyltransferase, partial [Brevibacterium sp.]